MSVAYSKTDTSLAVVIDFRPVTIPSSHPNFEQIVDLVRQIDTTEADLKPLIDIPKAIETFTGGNIVVTNGRLFFKGFEVKSQLAKIILDLIKQGQKDAARPFELFMEKAFANPDPRATTDLFEWVAASNLPITPDGDILAWKAVGNDYMSIHSGPRGKLDHSIGNVVEEPREECDADPSRTCSRGLHFCSVDYLRHYARGGHRVIAVAISPSDVVAFPKDYGNQKGRTFRMTVVGEVPFDQAKDYYPVKRGVYDGWQQQSTPKSKYAEGQVWCDNEGDNWTIHGTPGDFTAVLEGGYSYCTLDEASDTVRVPGSCSFKMVRRVS